MRNLIKQFFSIIFEVYLFAFVRITKINAPTWFKHANRLNSNYTNAIVVVSLAQFYFLCSIYFILIGDRNNISIYVKLLFVLTYLLLTLLNKYILIDKGYGLRYMSEVDNIGRIKRLSLGIMAITIFIFGLVLALHSLGKI